MGKSSFINASLISNESGIDLISSLAPGSVLLIFARVAAVVS